MKDIEERNKLVEDHLYMIDILIRKYLGKGVEYDDLYQAGALALSMQQTDSTLKRALSSAPLPRPPSWER